MTTWHIDDVMKDYDSLVIFDENSREICELRNPEDAEDEARMRANAAFIVLACNSHEAMLAASKRLLIALHGDTHPDWYEGMQGDAIDELEQAIRLAEGKEAHP